MVWSTYLILTVVCPFSLLSSLRSNGLGPSGSKLKDALLNSSSDNWIADQNGMRGSVKPLTFVGSLFPRDVGPCDFQRKHNFVVSILQRCITDLPPTY